MILVAKFMDVKCVHFGSQISPFSREKGLAGGKSWISFERFQKSIKLVRFNFYPLFISRDIWQFLHFSDSLYKHY